MFWGKKVDTGNKKKSVFREKLDMYDMIIANILAGKSVIEPEQKLNNSQIAIGFSNIASDNQITKYYIIRDFPDYMSEQMVDLIRHRCVRPGVKINFYFYCNPYKINWDSAEMKNKMGIWRRYSEENSSSVNVFDYRNKRGEALARERIIQSTRYLNEAELDQKRSIIRVAFVISVSADRTDESILNMIETINKLHETASSMEIKIKEIRINMIDWLKGLGIFSLRKMREIDSKLSRRIVTDDILANFNSYKQGRVGINGVPLGIDVLSGGPVLYKFKSDPDKAENWLISAETGGGKSYWVKALITYLLADEFIVTVMDYEGDEYTNLAAYIKAGNPDDVRVISMGKGSTIYFDPCEIPELTGDSSVDDELKESAVSYITSIFRVINCGLEGELTQWEERIISMAIQRMYESVGVTNDKETWVRSEGLKLEMVYDEIKMMVESKELVDNDMDNVRHKAAVKLVDTAAMYFEEGESKYGTFANPMSANELYGAKFIVFSFGMKGAATSINDPIILALKQLSVAYVSIQISNHCKYVKKCFNVKIWEEYQRWGEAKGSADIISNVMTGGRKRGDVNFIITNDLAAMLDDDNKLNEKLRQNIQSYAIGKIRDKNVRKKFCQKFDLQDIEQALDNIAKANTTEEKIVKGKRGAGNRFEHAFCVIMDNGKKAITKVRLPQVLIESSLFRAGVEVDNER